MVPEIVTDDKSWPYSKAKTSVLVAASAVIREHGPRSATLKNISAKAGITEPAIFRHFQGIDGLFGGLFAVQERISARLAAAYESDRPGLDSLVGAMNDAIDIYEASGDFAYLVIHAEQVFGSFPEFRKRMAEIRAADQAKVLACVRAAAKRDEVRRDVDALTIAIALSGAVYSSVSMWIDSDYSFSLRKFWKGRAGDLRLLALPTLRLAACAECSLN